MWVVWFYGGTFHTAPEQAQGPTPIVPHCSGSGPGACPDTAHSQCDYTITATNLQRNIESQHQSWNFCCSQTNLRECNVFRPVCQSGGGRLCMMSLPVWLLGPMFLLWGLCLWSHVTSRSVQRQTLDRDLSPPRVGGDGRYASYWNAFFLSMFLLIPILCAITGTMLNFGVFVNHQ